MGYVVFQVYSKLLLKTVLEHYIIDCDYLIAWLPRDQVKIVTLTDSCPKRYIFCNKTVGITITWWSCEQRCLIGIVSQSHYATLYNLLHRLAASDCATVVAACLPACFFLDIQLCPLFILHTWRRHCRAIFNWSCWMEHYVPNLLHFGQQERDTVGGDSLCNLNYRFWRARLDTGMRLNPVWFLYWVAVKKRSGLKFPLLEIA